MTTFYPKSCHCIITIPDVPYDESLAVLDQQCRTHNTAEQTFRHHRGFTQRDGNNSTKPQQEQQFRDMVLEKAKPQFQIRT